jgi:hypothetical protein
MRSSAENELVVLVLKHPDKNSGPRRIVYLNIDQTIWSDVRKWGIAS